MVYYHQFHLELLTQTIGRSPSIVDAWRILRQLHYMARLIVVSNRVALPDQKAPTGGLAVGVLAALKGAEGGDAPIRSSVRHRFNTLT
jgi:hypothetical protein